MHKPDTENDDVRTIGERVERVSGSAHEAWAQTRGAFSDLKDAIDLEGRLTRHPYRTVAAALGLGYVLGGGIFTKLTSRIVRLGLRIGLRVAVVPMLTDQIVGLAETLAREGTSAAQERGKGHPGSKGHDGSKRHEGSKRT